MSEVLYSEVYNKRVIYPNGNGGVSILIPSTSCASIENLIRDVPEGSPYQIIDISEIPNDRTYRNAWTYEEV